jgi:hypothetical protein
VSNWTPAFVRDNLTHPVLNDLQQRLFALIDVDDFLLRTIICRILLSLVCDSTSPLLLPIARIFYKLSCDPANDLFFVEESLEDVLLQLFRMSQPEGQVFTAGTIRNVAACAKMRGKLATPAFVDLIVETMEGDHDQTVKLQVLRAMRHMCSNDVFRRAIADRQLFGRLLADRRVFVDAMRIVALTPEISDPEKLQVLKILNEMDLTDPQHKRAVIRALTALSEGTLGSLEFGSLILRVLKVSLAEPEVLEFLLPLAQKSANSKTIQPDPVFVEILGNREYDTRIAIAAYAVVKEFPRADFAPIIAQYGYLDNINVKN